MRYTTPPSPSLRYGGLVEFSLCDTENKITGKVICTPDSMLVLKKAFKEGFKEDFE